MDDYRTFKKSDWIAQGKAWASVPPSIKKIGGEFFSIPQVLEYELLPSPFLPIAKLLEFPLPLEGTVAASQPAHGGVFQSGRKDCAKLLANSRQYWLDGFQSVIYSHLGGAVTHFPLWILTYWKAVVDIKRDVWGPWRKCQAWVNSQKKVAKKNPDRAALAEEAGLMLAMVPWGCTKPPGLSDSEPFHTLWRFVGP
ncbi:hypothetical protein B0H14DRAFT_3518181 [Mycena olivaceomarginata]|nr:hypothetical protein B0H14DRAFT_3518181 [Mycena olivaceomarginata]